jgi:hypothetical protein
MKPLSMIRPLAPALAFLLLTLAVPHPVSSQPVAAGSQSFAPELRERLAHAAADTRLPAWQREAMLDLAHAPGSAALAPTTGTPGALPARTSGAGDGSWSQLVLLGRVWHGAIYDPPRHRLIVYGGFDDAALSDVWALALEGAPAWTELAPTGTPPIARWRHSVIYDPVRDRMVVFGGADDSGTPHNDVWALSLAGTPAWTELTPTGTPPAPRAYHSAIYDPVRVRMIVFGGDANGGVHFNDVWALSLAGTPAWTQLTPTGTPPSPRWAQSMIYDPVRDQLVIFGGVDTGYRGDLWVLPLSGPMAWTQLTPGGTVPEARSMHSAIYDPSQDRMVMFGGGGDRAYGEVWALALAGAPAWTVLEPGAGLPGSRSGHSAAYDPAHGRMIVFGGYGWPHHADAWALALTGTPAWTEPTPSMPVPSVRMDHSAIYDPVRDRMIVFGGWDGTENLADVWTLSLAAAPTWTAETPAGTPPDARSGHGAIYDPVRDRMIVFGGYRDTSPRYLNDVWSLSLAGTPTWTALAPVGTPPSGRADVGAIYDPVRDRAIVFGGFSSTAPNYRNDVWSLSLAGTPTWTALAPVGTPPGGRHSLSAIYDPARDRMVVFGGSGSGGPFNDAWSLSLAGTPTWTALAPAGTPPHARYAHSAIYDLVRDRMVVFGGIYYDGSYYSLNDVWSLSLADAPAWSALAPGGGPPAPRSGHRAIYDPLRDRMVVFGSNDIPDVWALTWGEPIVPVQLTLVNAEASPDRVRLTWSVADGAAVSATVYRCTAQEAWTALGEASADGTGRIVYEDRAVSPGDRYGYRVGVRDHSGEIFAGETWVTVPRVSEFALAGARPNPADAGLAVAFSLPDATPARLEAFDLAGRLVAGESVGSLGGGSHLVRLGAGRSIAPGVYLLRLTRADRVLMARAVIFH